MHRLTLASLIVLGIVALTACGHSTPTSPTSSGLDPTTQATVSATVGQALSQTAASGATIISGGPSAFTFTRECPSGGSIVTTMAQPVVTVDNGTLTSRMSSRTEFNDCRSQNVVMRGDPALLHSTEYSSEARQPGIPITQTPPMTVTMRTTGAVIAASNGTESRVRFDCTAVTIFQFGSTSLPPTTFTGTMTWESPLGTVVRTSGCGQPQ